MSRRLVALITCCALWACDDSRPIPTPNPPGSSGSCGNGRVDKGETCDSRIATSSVGACPASCNDGIACTIDRKLGSPAACNVECAFDPISACVNGDGCCPMGCSGANDNDCSTTCGNNMVEANETCDGDCAAGCDDNIGCTLDTAYGEAASCSLSCGYRVRSGCAAGDGCCPAGCTSADDADCSTSCGNNMIDSGETCDGNCPASCEDGDACTIGVPSGSAANCNLACTQRRIRSCTAGDGCCAPGCTNATDSDCPAAPPSCELVSACVGGDTCCPSGCTNATDRDCPMAPVGSPLGGPCAQTSDCAPISGGTVTCARDGFPGGYCTMFCTSDPCPSGSQCSLAGFICAAECSLSMPATCARSGYVCDTRFNQLEQPFSGCLPGGA